MPEITKFTDSAGATVRASIIATRKLAEGYCPVTMCSEERMLKGHCACFEQTVDVIEAYLTARAEQARGAQSSEAAQTLATDTPPA